MSAPYAGVSGPNARRPVGHNVVRVGLVLVLAFAVLAGGAGYWQVFQAPTLARAPDNPAVVAAARNVVRGVIRDRDGEVLATSDRDRNGEPFRVYPHRAVTPVIGYASRLFGTAGLERAFDAELTGLSTGDPIDDLFRKFDPERYDPQALTLALSLDLQQAAVKGLGRDRGAVVMLDPTTGEVLALASTPTYDAAAIADPRTSREAFEAVRTDERQPLLNRATQGRYVPGSIFKVVTAIAAIGSGAVRPDTIFEEQPRAERDGLLVSGFRVREHPGVAARPLDLVGAMEVSSNIYFALAALETGGQALADWAGRLGFGELIPFDLSTRPSQVTNGGGGFGGGFKDDVELANAGYGQAETLVTPLQMALVTATVANDGILVRPRLVTEMTSEKTGTTRFGTERLRRVLSAEQARAIQAAMQEAVEGRQGRQYTTGAKVRGVPTAGKSGTAELGGRGEPHSWFIGFAPVEEPRVAIAIVVEQGGRGAERAAPLGGELMARYLRSIGIPE